MDRGNFRWLVVLGSTWITDCWPLRGHAPLPLLQAWWNLMCWKWNWCFPHKKWNLKGDRELMVGEALVTGGVMCRPAASSGVWTESEGCALTHTLAVLYVCVRVIVKSSQRLFKESTRCLFIVLALATAHNSLLGNIKYKWNKLTLAALLLGYATIPRKHWFPAKLLT